MAKPYMVGHQEFAALYRVEPQMVAQWLSPSRGTLDPATATVISGVRYWPLGFACRYGTTTRRPKRIDETVQARIMAEQGEGWLADLGDELPPIVGQHELIQVFHLPSQGTLAMRIAAGNFPPPTGCCPAPACGCWTRCSTLCPSCAQARAACPGCRTKKLLRPFATAHTTAPAHGP